VNLIHTCVTYGDSTRKIRVVLEERLDECILALKIGGGRTKEYAEERLRESLSEFLQRRRISFALRNRLITVKKSRDKEQFDWHVAEGKKNCLNPQVAQYAEAK